MDGLREAILRGDLSPGTKLQEVEIAEQYETSRTPVREALRQLESEGFIVIKARRGAYVTPITAKDIQEFYEVKAVLEGHAARIAVERLTDDQINRMETLNELLRRCYQSGDIAGMIPVHNEFHEIFVQASGNERLAGILKSLVSQFQRFRITISHSPAIEESIRLHDEIIRAFRDRDPERAADLVARNSTQGSVALLSSLNGATNGAAR